MKEPGILPVKGCFRHVGGVLGERLLRRFVERGWMEPDEERERRFVITPLGCRELTALGVDVFEK